MSSYAQVISYKQLGNFERAFVRELKVAGNRALRACVAPVRTILASNSSSIRDTGAFQKGWNVVAHMDRLNIDNMVSHAIYVEGGRRAGARMPPVSVIRAWLIRRGADPRLAFPVARAIARRGIKPRPVYKNSMRKIMKLVTKRVEAAWGDAVARSMKS